MTKKNYDGWSNSELVKEIKKLEKRKKYGLVWDSEKNPEEVVELCKEKLPILEEDKDKEIKKDNKKQMNILIEGDNYHALSVLNYTHKGKVDVIYIDPPYNTGNEGFIYNDKHIDYTDSYRHSKWLSFMEKRLKLAKNLLKRDGIILISIDYNEIAQLKMLCDEIFNERNFIDIFSWVRTETPARLSKKSLKVVEYILCYQKSNELKSLKGFKSISKSGNTLLNQTNAIKTLIFPPKVVSTGIKNGIVKKGKYGSGSYEVILEEDTQVANGFFVKPIKLTAKFRWTQKKLEKEIENSTSISIKTKTLSPSYDKKEYATGPPKNILDRNSLVYTNETAKQELKEIFHSNLFDYPKPTSLIKYLCGFVNKKDLLILDFFAGSGTTGHAILNLNKEDGGNRKFILCTNNEQEISTKICYPRIKKVIEGYMGTKGKKVNATEGNLKYFRTGFVEADQTDTNKKKLVDKSTEMLCLKENCYEEVKKDTDFKIFKNSEEKYLGIIYDDNGIGPFIKEIERLNKKFIVYVFSLDESAREEEFEKYIKMVKLKPIPAAILNTYRRIFK
jgi:adenine-specific DNA-methyltransferase